QRNAWSSASISAEPRTIGRPRSKVPVPERIQGHVRMTKGEALALEEQHTLFGFEEEEAEVYKYATHFRRQLKARLLNDKIVTQIARETTLAPYDFLKSNGRPKRRVEDPATIAWKLTTGAYYKDGGRPWQLADATGGSATARDPSAYREQALQGRSRQLLPAPT